MSQSNARSIAVPVLPQLSPFELGVLCEVFGIDRTEQGVPTYEFWVCGEEPGTPISTKTGFDIVPRHPMDKLDDAAIVAVPASPPQDIYSEVLLAALRRAVDRGALVVSVCSGAFVLGAAGLLDGRRCTTHWMYAEELQRRHPSAKVDPDVLYVTDGPVWTSAGTAAGIDLCLHLMREREGSAVVQAIARRMVVPPHRAGGQKQYVETPVPKRQSSTLEPVLTWMMANLDRPVTVVELAERAHMAPRTFARRFRAEAGATPHDWLTTQRVLLARRLLEETDLTVDAIAVRAGFGNAAALRHHFTSRVGAGPNAYRTTFRIQREPA
jgi:AraC family transcriptional regulator, transcriptional activator FtrA